MEYTDENTYSIREADRHHRTPRAGPLSHADVDFPTSGLDLLPPPVPPKDGDLQYWPVVTAQECPTRVTPWLLRRVKTPVSAPQAPVQVTRSIPADVRRSPKPPSYQAAQAQESYPRVERSGRVLDRSNAANTSSGVSSAAPGHSSRHTPTKPARHDKRDKTEVQRSAISCPSQSSLRSSHRERSRPRTPAQRVVPQPAQPQNYPPYEPFPPPPPYHASKESLALSSRSRPPHRIHKKSSASGKEVSSLEQPCHPPPPGSPESRIRAAYSVSKEFGDAVMRQELRVAIPADHPQRDPTPTPRATRRFMSVTEAEGLRKAKERVDKSSREHEARQRTLSKPSSHAKQGYGESRKRAISVVKSGRVHHEMEICNTLGQRC
ncbi:hypothetical protein BJV78DRAFT_1278722 [Lactifluus subvellereus]|nr:hypothetical protein BJV78DRAFT_1278722 [Lactifluus subvellereus]